MKVARGLCLVRPAETEQTIAGGKIILVDATREAIAQYQCEVVDIGLPETCDDENCDRPHDFPQASHDAEHPIPASLCVGSWVLVKPRSFIAASETENLFFVRQDAVEAVLRAE